MNEYDVRAVLDQFSDKHQLAVKIVEEAFKCDNEVVWMVDVQPEDMKKHVSEVRARAAILSKDVLERYADELADAILSLELDLCSANFKNGCVNEYKVNVSVK